MTRYYSFDRVDKKDAVINMVIGGRGIGKSYGAKVRAVRDALDGNGQFVYMRRFETELVESVDPFVDDIFQEFPGVEFEVKQRVLYGDGEPLGMFIALSRVHHFKSVPFDKYRTLIFDEFIAENGRYLPAEWGKFLGFMVTADRYKDRIKAYLLGNSVTVYSPYTSAVGAVLEKGTCRRYMGGFVCVHVVDDDEYDGGRPTSRLGRFIEGTEYGGLVMNEFTDGGAHFIEPRSGGEYELTLVTPAELHVYDMGGGRRHIGAVGPRSPQRITAALDCVRSDVDYVPANAEYIASLRRAFGRGAIAFDSASTRERFTKWIGSPGRSMLY